MDLGIIDKVAIITGAARGLGASIAEVLAEEGVKVVLADINEAGAVATAKALSDRGLSAIGVGGNVMVAADIEAMVAKAAEAFGPVNIIVNNAAIPRDGFLTKMTEEDWDLVTGIILKGAFLLTRAAVPSMIAQKWGRIINISSRAIYGNAGQANYSTAKAGLLGLTRALAIEEGRYNITVNAVAPGFTETEMTMLHPKYEQIKDATIKNTPIPRVAYPSDIAHAVAFLASERASFISGETLHVTGGRYG